MDKLNQKKIPLDFSGGFFKLTKIEHLMERPHPNGIDQGAIRSGYSQYLPKVGESFIISHKNHGFHTSEVIEVDYENQIFKTRNSIYKWEVK